MVRHDPRMVCQTARERKTAELIAQCLPKSLARAGVCILVCTVGLSNWAFAGGIPNSSDHNEVTEDVQRLGSHWPELVQRSMQVAAEHCAVPNASTRQLAPKILFQGEVVDLVVSPTGVVAIADQKNEQAVIFAKGVDHAPLPPISFRGAFAGETMRLSDDGRFVAWSSTTRLYVFDVIANHLVSTTVMSIFDDQWIGDDLLFIGSDPNDFNHKSTVLMKWDGNGFREQVLSTWAFGKETIAPETANAGKPTDESVALSDQFGSSFLSGDNVYRSVTDVLRDGRGFILHRNTIYRDRVYRLGRTLLQLGDNGNYFLANDKAPWLLILRDGRSGKVIQTAPVALPWCVPKDIAVTSGGTKFAALVSGTSILIVDASDLVARMVYGLQTPRMTLKSIAFLPGHRLLALGESLTPRQSAVLVYDLSE